MSGTQEHSIQHKLHSPECQCLRKDLPVNVIPLQPHNWRTLRSEKNEVPEPHTRILNCLEELHVRLRYMYLTMCAVKLNHTASRDL